MAGTGWKAAGTVLIILGALAVVLGVGGAAMGGAVFADAIGDAESCGGLFDPCDDSIQERGETGMAVAAAGLGVAGFGLVIVIIGVVLVFVGVSRARDAQARTS